MTHDSARIQFHFRLSLLLVALVCGLTLIPGTLHAQSGDEPPGEEAEPPENKPDNGDSRQTDGDDTDEENDADEGNDEDLDDEPLNLDLDELEEEPLDIPLDDAADGADSDEGGSGSQHGNAGDDGVMTIAPVYVEYSRKEVAETPGSVTKLDEETLETYEQDDPNQVLLMAPGVYVRQEDGFGLRPNIGIRGASAERSKKVTLMEDGILLAPAPYSAPAAYYFPLMTRMKAVEVFKGPAAIKFGPHTVGGAINFVSREIPYAAGGGIDAALGMYNTGKLDAHYGGSNDWGGFLVEGTHIQSDGFKDLDGGGDTGFTKSEVFVRGRLNTDLDAWDFHKVDVRLGYSRERSNETYTGLSDEDFHANPYRRYAATQKDRMEWDRFLAHVHYRLELGDDFDMTTSLYRHDFSRAWRKLNGFVEGTSLKDILADPTGRRAILYSVLTGEEDSASPDETLILGTNDRTFVSEGGQVIGHHRYANDFLANELEFGLRVHYDQIDRNHTEELFDMRSGNLADTGAEEETATLNTGSALAIAAHLVDEISFAGLTFTPGVRVEWIRSRLADHLADRSTKNDQLVFLPGLGVFYAITEQIGVLAGFHRGFSPVSPGQPDSVDPETSWNVEAGARFFHEETDTLIEVIGFFNDYQNLLGECTFSVGCQEEQVDDQVGLGEVWVWGVEVVASHRFDVGDFQIPLRVAYTYTGSEFQTRFSSDNPEFGTVEEGDHLPYIPSHQVSAQAGFGNERFTVHTNVTSVSEMWEEAGQGEIPDGLATDPYFLLDLILHLNVLDNFAVYGKIDNVTATDAIISRRPYGARPVKPTLGQVGVKAKF